jgi:hypothetical protein
MRYLAAVHARNEVVVHVDDDAEPDAHNLNLMSRSFCSVHAETGFPTCAPHPPCNPMWSACGLHPYHAPCTHALGIPTARPLGFTGRRRATAARQATAHRCE